jgi:hypothetical protein
LVFAPLQLVDLHQRNILTHENRPSRFVHTTADGAATRCPDRATGNKVLKTFSQRIPCRLTGSSNPVERSNNLVTARRQKRKRYAFLSQECRLICRFLQI